DASCDPLLECHDEATWAPSVIWRHLPAWLTKRLPFGNGLAETRTIDWSHVSDYLVIGGLPATAQKSMTGHFNAGWAPIDLLGGPFLDHYSVPLPYPTVVE
ncbi:MAG TPA: hypothetical protein VNM37_10735, partial [Candidatus Dormibacteraeota bacterium]|nr:hypothetical protein [Candidatus Dormibacteraeota bacterium]